MAYTDKNRIHLIKDLLDTNFQNIDTPQRIEIIEYLLDNKSHLIKYRWLRHKATDFFGKHINLIPTDKLKEQVRDFLVDVTIDEARKDFYVYAKMMANVVLPNNFIDGRHIKKICEELQAVAESIESPEPTKRSMFFMPPGSMKTVLCSIMFPSWLYGVHPNWHVIVVGYNDEFASDKIGHPLRELMQSKEYKTIFPNTIIRQDSRSKDRFVTTQKGEFKALGAKARAAGRRAHLLICDDTISEKDAWSKSLRTEINKNYIGGLRSRLMRTPRGAEIITNTRYHLEDISGFLLNVDKTSKRPWHVVSLPAILDEKASKFLRESKDPPELYAVGTSFWPEMQPLELLEEERDSYMKTEPHKWHALYLQQPTPAEGNIIKYEDWKWWGVEVEEGKEEPPENKPPSVTQILVSMDTAFSESERADYSAYTVWGTFTPLDGTASHLILLKAEKGKWGWHELVEKCHWIKDRYKPDFFIVEKKSSGQTLIQDLYRKGFPIVEFDPRGKKEERLQSASLWFKQGRIWVPRNRDWAKEVVEEVCSFPSSPHYDMTDTVSQAIIWYRDMGVVNFDRTEDDEDLDKYTQGKTYWRAMFSTR